MIATTDKFYARPIEEELINLGANVLFSNASPHRPDNVSSIADEVRNHKVDALLIHYPNTSLAESMEAVIELTEQFTAAIPVIVNDTNHNVWDITEIRNAGATYLDSENKWTHVAAKVADLVGDRTKKSGRTLAGGNTKPEAK